MAFYYLHPLKHNQNILGVQDCLQFLQFHWQKCSHVSSHLLFNATNHLMHHRRDIHDNHYLKLAQFEYDILQKKKFTCYKFHTLNQILLTFTTKVSKFFFKFKDENKIYSFFFTFLANSNSISPLRTMRCSTSPSTQILSTFSPSSSSPHFNALFLKMQFV